MLAIERGVRVDSRLQCLGAKATHQPDAGPRKRGHHEIDGPSAISSSSRVTDHAEVVPPERVGDFNQCQSSNVACELTRARSAWELRQRTNPTQARASADTTKLTAQVPLVLPPRVADHAEVVPPQRVADFNRC